MANLPTGYRRLEGTEWRLASKTSRSGPADLNEIISISVYVRPHPGAPPLPDLEYWMKPQPPDRRFLSHEEFARRYSAGQADLDKVVSFAHLHGLSVDEMNATRRVVRLSGTVAQMNKAFAVALGRYESEDESYRGYEGFIHLPSDLTDIVQAVFGLDNRRVAQPGVVVVTPQQVTKQYDFPPEFASGQTIGIISLGGGYLITDINAYFASIGLLAPTVTAVSVDSATNTPGVNVRSDQENILDICVAASAAPGAAIAVYFTPNTSQGWVDAITTAIHDTVNRPSVLSISWSGDENSNWSASARYNVELAFQAAAALGISVFVSSGDLGSNNNQNDGKAHVKFPAANPWVTSCGGTVIQTLIPYVEGTWNDASGATGGGISSTFGLPPYQKDAGIPPSINDGVSVGRGVPDVAGNAGGQGGG
jgi:kumamolisin